MATAVHRLSDQQLYERFLSRDKALDGSFITGVLTTGIYCLPSCPARKPKFKNVRFFMTEAEAVAAGLRPCQRCRPNLFYRGEDWDLALLEGLMARVAPDPAAFRGVGDLAAKCGVGVTKLSELFRIHLHVSPALYLTRARVRRACDLLANTNHSVTDIGYEVGFESSTAYHAQFRGHTGMAPKAYREMLSQSRFTLQLPVGFRAAETLAFLSRDPYFTSERVEGNTFYKAVRLDDRQCVLQVELTRKQAHCSVHSLDKLRAEDIARLHRVALRLLGLTMDPRPFETMTRSSASTKRLIGRNRGLRVPQTTNVFDAVVWAILGQQVNLAFASAMRRDLALACAPGQQGLVPTPSAGQIAQLKISDLLKMRMSRSKAEYLHETASRVADGSLDVEAFPGGTATRAAKQMEKLRGFGPWTTQYILMRGCGFLDCAPIGDSALTAGLQRLHGLEKRPDAKQTAQLMAEFTPYRSLATLHLWMSLKRSEGEKR